MIYLLEDVFCACVSTHLLKGLLELVEVDGRVVAHDADGAELVQGLEVGSLDLLSLEEHVSDGLVGAAGDLELQEAAVVALNLVEDEHPAQQSGGGYVSTESVTDRIVHDKKIRRKALRILIFFFQTNKTREH